MTIDAMIQTMINNDHTLRTSHLDSPVQSHDEWLSQEVAFIKSLGTPAPKRAKITGVEWYQMSLALVGIIGTIAILLGGM